MQFSLTISTAMMKCSYLKSQSHLDYRNAWHILAYLGSTEFVRSFLASRLIAPLEHLAAQEETVIRDQEPSGAEWSRVEPSGAVECLAKL